jgi:hypothetical protein
VKVAATNPAEQRRQWILLGVLAIVALSVWYFTPSGEPATEQAPPASNPPVAARGQATGQQSTPALPQPLRLRDLEPVPVQTSAARNPFGFGFKPAPPPPPAPPAPPPAPVRQAPPPPSGPPPLPAIPVKFLGFMEDPARPGKVVALGLNGGVVLAREGELVDGRYRLLRIGLDSIVMAYPDGRGQQTIKLTGS